MSQRRIKPKRLNYLSKIVELARSAPPMPGTVNHIRVAHDDWCPMLKGKGECTCDPDVSYLGARDGVN